MKASQEKDTQRFYLWAYPRSKKQMEWKKWRRIFVSHIDTENNVV